MTVGLASLFRSEDTSRAASYRIVLSAKDDTDTYALYMGRGFDPPSKQADKQTETLSYKHKADPSCLKE